MSSYIKDPQETLDYTWDWSSWLTTGETIDSATVTATTGITLAPTGRATVTASPKVTAWLAGGTEGQTYSSTCTVTTSAGRIGERTIRVRVMQR